MIKYINAGEIPYVKKDGKRMAYKDDIDEILSANVRENKYGKNLNDEFYDTDQFICSECGLHLQDWEKIIGDGEIEEFEFKFCPNCGADMRGETE